jgi:hypothetical protein
MAEMLMMVAGGLAGFAVAPFVAFALIALVLGVTESIAWLIERLLRALGIQQHPTPGAEAGR